jgi:hypothetical protein
MVDWEITVTTVYCDAIDEEVTFVVNADGAWRCTGRQKYAVSDKQAAKSLKMKSKKTGKSLKCAGAECPTANGYRDKLLGKSK